GEGARRGRSVLLCAGLRAGRVGLRNGPLLDGPQRGAGRAIEHEDESVLRGLRHDVYVSAVVPNSEKLRRSRKIVVPEIVMNDLIVPESFARPRIERNQTVAEQVRAVAIASVEIVSGRSERDIRDAPPLVARQLAPVVGTGAPRRGRFWPPA